jgi:YD repeat-containing protein
MSYTADGLLTEFTDAKDNVSRYDYDPLGRLIGTEDAAGGGWTLSRTDLPDGHEASITSAEGRTTRYRVEHLPIGDRLRTNIHPDGTVETTRIGTGGQRTITAPTVLSPSPCKAPTRASAWRVPYRIASPSPPRADW